jgi:hypothetical protein
MQTKIRTTSNDAALRMGKRASDFQRLVPATVIDDHELPVLIGLKVYSIDGFAQMSGSL